MDELAAVVRARELLSCVTPLKGDCGRACGAACCQPDGDGQGGMLLFPGEEALYSTLPPGFALSRDDGVMPGMTLLVCQGSCARAERPLSCRLFPLTPVIDAQDGRERLRVMPDPRAWPVCPLMPGGLRGLDARFVEAVRQAAKELARCERHRAYLRALYEYFTRLRAL